MVESRT